MIRRLIKYIKKYHLVRTEKNKKYKHLKFIEEKETEYKENLEKHESISREIFFLQREMNNLSGKLHYNKEVLDELKGTKIKFAIDKYQREQ